MSEKLLSRIELKDNVPAAALRAVLMPDHQAVRAATSHHLIWTLFADSADRVRDFLWREHKPGLFYVLSDRPPLDRHGLFEVMPPKEFAPALSPGDELTFEMRVNATVSRNGGPGVRGKPCDIVMDAIHHSPIASRAESRDAVVVDAANQWMMRQGEKHGFAPGHVQVHGYSVLSLDRGRMKQRARLGVLDLSGRIIVKDSSALLHAIAAGFGRGKAFGCGLMMVRRAH